MAYVKGLGVLACNNGIGLVNDARWPMAGFPEMRGRRDSAAFRNDSATVHLVDPWYLWVPPPRDESELLPVTDREARATVPCDSYGLDLRDILDEDPL